MSRIKAVLGRIEKRLVAEKRGGGNDSQSGKGGGNSPLSEKKRKNEGTKGYSSRRVDWRYERRQGASQKPSRMMKEKKKKSFAREAFSSLGGGWAVREQLKRPYFGSP